MNHKKRRTIKVKKQISKSQPKYFGEDNPNSKLTNVQRQKIVELYNTTKTTYRELAERFDVNISTIRRILN